MANFNLDLARKKTGISGAFQHGRFTIKNYLIVKKIPVISRTFTERSRLFHGRYEKHPPDTRLTRSPI